ncbi:Uncharacterised protein [Pseudomonas luteola]|uniref:Uncharacterized protein n=1 Tax=Pseudomonas luteola TaxID=47886 RepID=A0A2X2BWI2_PSELU|nr:Uncharacterised protein [Pseudomonas luteola]SPZ00057.1 Uncharacterised protein [Pseudomonas luteola]
MTVRPRDALIKMEDVFTSRLRSSSMSFYRDSQQESPTTLMVYGDETEMAMNILE